jgi:ATP-dependent DNA helicase DinG
MNEPQQNEIYPPGDYFPMKEAREKQVRGLDFFHRKWAQGYTDIVIEAPTGIGKSAMGEAIALWAAQEVAPEGFKPGAYYLVTQKLLQDQLSGDNQKFIPEFANRICSLKSSIEYACTAHGTCFAGSRKECGAIKARACNYRSAKATFNRVPIAVTNYPYFFTEHVYIGAMEPRRVVIADECHTLEKQLLGFVELTVNQEIVEEWAPFLLPVPNMPKLENYVDWVGKKFLPVVEQRIQILQRQIEDSSGQPDRKVQDELTRAESFFGRTILAFESIQENPKNWVYWQEVVKGDGRHSIAKPISAVPFVDEFIRNRGAIRLYMSAYPGPKNIFCRSLGLDPDRVAWLQQSSTFPVANRPIHLTLVGSMGRSSIEQTLPSVLRMCERIMTAHKAEKGLIHCHSYKLGEALYTYLSRKFPGRIFFPREAKERDSALAMHASTDKPTVLLSPSMTEGFNLYDDLARFQIITKMPYPYLGDRQVEAKKNLDPEWYQMQTVMTVIQACGRIVRSDTDTGVTYILDSDFKMLYEKHGDFFPNWFKAAFVWHNK